MNDETDIARAILNHELKTLESIAAHLPRQSSKDQGVVGVSSRTAWQWITRGNLPLRTGED